MLYTCCIRDCSSLKTVFRVPKDDLIKNQWEKALGILFKKSHHVCAAHFNHNDIISAWESGDIEDSNFKYRVRLTFMLHSFYVVKYIFNYYYLLDMS